LHTGIREKREVRGLKEGNGLLNEETLKYGDDTEVRVSPSLDVETVRAVNARRIGEKELLPGGRTCQW